MNIRCRVPFIKYFNSTNSSSDYPAPIQWSLLISRCITIYKWFTCCTRRHFILAPRFYIHAISIRLLFNLYQNLKLKVIKILNIVTTHIFLIEFLFSNLQKQRGFATLEDANVAWNIFQASFSYILNHIYPYQKV